MAAQSDPYVRVYYRVLDDPKFVDVFDDDRAFAWWARLLLFADMAYPAPANLPRKLPNAIRDKLSNAGLIDLLAGDRYRMHGLAAEREHRTDLGRNAANARWGNADAMQTHSGRNADPMHSEPNRTKPNQTNGRAKTLRVDGGPTKVGDVVAGLVQDESGKWVTKP